MLMCKFYFSLLAAMMLVATVSAQTKPTFNSRCFNASGGVEEVRHQVNRLSSHKLTLVGRLDNQLSGLMKVKAEATSDQLITETPTGELFPYAYGRAHGYYVFWGSVVEGSSDGNVMEFVDGDTDFYVKNPFSTLVTGSWLKGEKKNAVQAAALDTVIVSLPQPIYIGDVEDSEGNVSTQTLYASRLAINYDETGQKKVTYADNQTMKFTWDGDTLKKVGGDDVLGLTNLDGGWFGYGDDSIMIYKIKELPVEVPAFAQKSKYVMSFKYDESSRQAKVVQVAMDGNDVYVGGLVDGQNLWAKGTLSGNKVVFEKQYLGIDSKELYHKFFIPVKVDSTYDESWGSWTLTTTAEDKLEFEMDAATGKLFTAKDFIVNTGEKNLQITTLYAAVQLAPWEDKAYTPLAPKFVDFMPYEEVYGYGGVKFDMPTADAEGHYLDNEKLFFTFYFDSADNPYTFTPQYAAALTDNMVEIPATFSDNYDFLFSDSQHTVYFNDPAFGEIAKLGVKAIYKGGEEIKESAITWFEPAGIGTQTTDRAQVKSVRFTDISGREVARPNSGLYLKTVKYDDGSVKTEKVFIGK